MKTFKQGQKVRLTDPVHIAARFYRPDWSALVGAGGMPIKRELIDGDAYVCSVGKDKTRGLVVFGSPDSNTGMWLDINDVVKA